MKCAALRQAQDIASRVTLNLLLFHKHLTHLKQLGG